MNFDFTPEQIVIREHVRAFALREIAPKAAENDRNCHFDWDIAKKIFKEGFLGCPIPEQYGGLGQDYISYGLLTEEINRVCSSTRTLFSVQTSLVALTILRWGTEEQKQKYLPGLCNGDILGCYGLTEPDAGSDAGNQQLFIVWSKNLDFLRYYCSYRHHFCYCRSCFKTQRHYLFYCGHKIPWLFRSSHKRETGLARLRHCLSIFRQCARASQQYARTSRRRL